MSKILNKNPLSRTKKLYYIIIQSSLSTHFLCGLIFLILWFSIGYLYFLGPLLHTETTYRANLYELKKRGDLMESIKRESSECEQRLTTYNKENTVPSREIAPALMSHYEKMILEKIEKYAAVTLTTLHSGTIVYDSLFARKPLTCTFVGPLADIITLLSSFTPGEMHFFSIIIHTISCTTQGSPHSSPTSLTVEIALVIPLIQKNGEKINPPT